MKRSGNETEKSREKGAKNGGTNTIADFDDVKKRSKSWVVHSRTSPRDRDNNCPTVRTVSERKRILRKEGRCKECLGVHEGKCEKGSKCFYYNFRKLHNQEATDHHASICTSPEELVELEEQRRRAREERDYCIRRLAEIDEERH
ncbi:unnamed protein product [Heligmosomoides polygyrus]|uniref:C3H1-type domain-containing protein n=1 Tax=Heligmosomoides polygyrus TaxID=6339 RepID=A0A183FNI0_HELPZ|nr:unnamed protein product [Heligmosomoides polygyrus]